MIRWVSTSSALRASRARTPKIAPEAPVMPTTSRMADWNQKVSRYGRASSGRTAGTRPTAGARFQLDSFRFVAETLMSLLLVLLFGCFGGFELNSSGAQRLGLLRRAVPQNTGILLSIVSSLGLAGGSVLAIPVQFSTFLA